MNEQNKETASKPSKIRAKFKLQNGEALLYPAMLNYILSEKDAAHIFG